ncbi:hypothetical protein [Dinoroseobacter sp. S124A]|uniref:hypothetical protein n=1 Tax=Dinoroseobacter sp. S124A TaxID=3415128 RepID=UPI003C7BF5DE
MSDPEEFELPERPVLHLTPAPFKRGVSAAMLFLLAFLLGYVLLLHPPASFGWMAFLGVMTAGAGWLGISMAQARPQGLELRSDGLYRADGEVICLLSEIVSVNRGAFAFKPSNGFLLRLAEPRDRAWMPGLYWRLGRFVGVGGVTHKAQGDMIAETIALTLSSQGKD